MSENVNVFIEISKGSNKKYELDSKGELKISEVLNPGYVYPANYGFIPETKAEDNDELDILVFSDEKIEQKSRIKARVIDIMYMIDRGVNDNKVIAVKTTSTVKQLSDKHKEELKRFFIGYKNKKVIIKGFGGRQKALKDINRAYY